MVQSQAHPISIPRLASVNPPMPSALGAPRTGDSANTLAYLALISELQNQVNTLQSERGALLGAVRTLEQSVQQAARIQRDALPQIPEVDGAEVTVLYQPLDGVSGDAYHFQNLDESSVGIGLLDASDHGMPAAILTSGLMTALRIAQERLSTGELANSADVLSVIQDQLASMELTGCEFAAGLHAVYDSKSRKLTFARAGTPYPICIRPDGTATALVSGGPILGAIDDATFNTITVQLEPGDTVVFATDGLEALLATQSAPNASPETVLTEWFEAHKHQSVDETFAGLCELLNQCNRKSWHADDVTAIALQITA